MQRWCRLWTSRNKNREISIRDETQIWNFLIDYAAVEQDENARPELISQIESLEQYDTIFVDYPT